MATTNTASSASPARQEVYNQGYTLNQYQRIKPMLDWIGEYQAGIESANKANEYRYQQGLGLWGDISKMYEGWNPDPQKESYYDYGKGQRADIEQQRKAGTAESMASLMGSGLAASTAAQAVQQQYRKTAAQQNMNLSDAIAQYRQQQRDYHYQQNLGLERERMGNIAQATTGKLGWIQAKEDLGPSEQFMTGVMQMFAQKPHLWKQASEAYGKKYGLAG